jgi:hypothetical protein
MYRSDGLRRGKIRGLYGGRAGEISLYNLRILPYPTSHPDKAISARYIRGPRSAASGVDTSMHDSWLDLRG